LRHVHSAARASPRAGSRSTQYSELAVPSVSRTNSRLGEARAATAEKIDLIFSAVREMTAMLLQASLQFIVESNLYVDSSSQKHQR
jgi:hypothetical protein